MLLVPTRAKWHLCGGFVGRVLAGVVPSRTAVLPPASGSGLPLPVLSSNPAFPSSPSCSQWPWAAYCPDSCWSWWRLWLLLHALAPSQGLPELLVPRCRSWGGHGEHMCCWRESCCPLAGRSCATAPGRGLAVSCHGQCASLPPKPCIPAELSSCQELSRTDLRMHFDPSACVRCFILLGRNLLGFFFFKKVKT